MMHVWKKLMTALLIFALLLSITGAVAEEAEVVYGVCTANDVNVRKTAGTNGVLWFKIDKGHVAQITGEKVVSGKVWYRINTEHPTPNGHTYIGYVLSDYFREMTEEETQAYLESNATPVPAVTPTPTPGSDDEEQGGDDHVEYNGQEVMGAYGVTNTDAELRTQPSAASGSLLAVIPENTTVTIRAIPQDGDGEGWYRVEYNGIIGYVHAGQVTLITAGATPTPDPGFGTEVSDTWGVITADNVNFRSEPKRDTNNANVIAQLDEGTEVEILTVPDEIGADYWYRVRYDGAVGYVQSNYVRIISGDPTEEPTPTPTPTAEPEKIVVTTGVITADGVNFRTGAGLEYGIYGKLNSGTVVELLSIPDTIDANHWYKIRYNGQVGYIQAPYIRVLTIDESYLPDPAKYGYAKLLEDSANLRDVPGGQTVIQWKGKGSLLRIVGVAETKGSFDWYPVYYDAKNTIYYVRDDMIEVVMVEDGVVVTPTPEPESTYGYVITTESGVNLRLKPFGESVAQVPKGTILACVGPTEQPEGTSYTWYKVKYQGMTGYLRGDCVRVCTADGGDVAATPEPVATPTGSTTVYGYIRLVKNKVNLRTVPLGASQIQLPLNMVLPQVGPVVQAGEFGRYCWYHVRTADGMVGYIRGDCAVVTDETGAEATPVPPVTPTPAPDGTEVVGATGMIIKNTIMFAEASTDSEVVNVIMANTVVDVLYIPEDAESGNGWYRIRYNGQEGYVRASMLKLINSGTVATPTPSTDVSPYGYVMINDKRVNFRNAPAGTKIYRQLDKGTVWPMVGEYAVVGEVKWYPINVNGQIGYVHGGFSFKLSPSQQESYLAGNGVPEETPSPDSVLTSFVITTADKVNLRASYSLDSDALYQVRTGTVMPFAEYKTVGSVTWYHVVYDNQEVWVHGSYVAVMTQAEYQAWLVANPDAVPDVTANLGYLKLIKDNVYIRNAANGSTVIDKLRLGTVIRYYSDKIPGGSYYWYRVLTPDGEFGYIRSDMVEICDQYGAALPTPTPNFGDVSSAPASQQETEYTTLKLGSSGYRVANLVQELINQGYFKGALTSNYTQEVYDAVKAFQTVKGLTANGIANAATQHALFGTVPIGSGDTSNLSFAIYPVEKIDWFTGGIQEMLPRGAKFKIYDVKTGIVWWAYRQAGGKHMDIETLTAADSARLCQIYGVNNLQQIVDENKWQRRPSLVTIGTRTFACSLDGMQHGDDTISNNNMDGQVCLHFTNSQGHASGVVSTSHAEAIEYAYNNCPAGKK